MAIRIVSSREKKQYSQGVEHLVQSWEWGEFRAKTGVEVVRLGRFAGKKLEEGYQLTFHPLPFGGCTVGYFPKGPWPDKALINALKKLGQEKKAVFIKLEPAVIVNGTKLQIPDPRLVVSPQPLFTRHNFLIDLAQSEKDLLAGMKSKTRYNLRLARRKGVKVVEKNDPVSFEIYLRLYFDTCRRQGYFGHDREYHRQMWETLAQAGMVHLLIASFKKTPLAAWMLLEFKDTLYYPYGGSSTKHRNLMASNLICWEAMKLGKKRGLKTLDLWGALGPEAGRSHPWYGWHRFKAGYGGKLVEYGGSLDLILSSGLYRFFNLVNQLRWKLLRVKSSLKVKG